MTLDDRKNAFENKFVHDLSCCSRPRLGHASSLVCGWPEKWG